MSRLGLPQEPVRQIH
uniref:Nudix hydrolase 7 n=2 Tax=Pan TaxID=9596 RepID=A0A2I3RI05_PANTR